MSPQVQVKVKQFNSKKIQIIGQIAKPGPLPYQDGMTLVQAISAAGWFTPLADTNHVQLIRIVNGGEVRERHHQRRRHHRQRPRRREAPAGRHDQGRPAPLLKARGSRHAAPAPSPDGRHDAHDARAAGRGAARLRKRPLTLDEERTSRDLVAEVPSLARIAELETRLLFHMDSANMQPADWVTIAREVHAQLPSYDGIVIVHGTDTMAYTASALALMLGPLPKPVVLTGSQKPIVDVRTDARQNLIDAALVATLAGPRGVHRVGVARAARRARDEARRVGLQRVRLAEPAAARRARHRHRGRSARRPADAARRRSTDGSSRASSRCASFPGSTRTSCAARSGSACAGSSSRPTARERCRTSAGSLIPALEEARERGVPVVVVSQCLRGFVDLGRYEGGAAAEKAGAISGGNMTVEAALAKMMIGLARHGTGDGAPRVLRGERRRRARRLALTLDDRRMAARDPR